MRYVHAFVRSLQHPDEAQDLLEYALLVGLIALVAVGGVSMVGQQLDTVMWQAIAAMI